MMAESGELAIRRDALRSEHTDLVKAIAYQFFRRRNHVDFLALIQAGMTGLSAAMSGHEHETAEVFEAYASALIREAMLDVVRRSDSGATSVRRDGQHV
jgi:DNA-directed RNA polymerase specialized sigma subunit